MAAHEHFQVEFKAGFQKHNKVKVCINCTPISAVQLCAVWHVAQVTQDCMV